MSDIVVLLALIAVAVVAVGLYGAEMSKWLTKWWRR